MTLKVIWLVAYLVAVIAVAVYAVRRTIELPPRDGELRC
jgi:hypothetical protein